MRDVTYWHAWSLWWDGEPTENLRLWGQPMVVWARAGKVLQLLGAVTVIVDIIGATRLKRMGRRLNSRADAIRRGRHRWADYRRGLISRWGTVIFMVFVLPIVLFGAFLPGKPWIWEVFEDPASLLPLAAPYVLAALLYVVPIAAFRLVEAGAAGLDRLVIGPVAGALSLRPVDLWAKVAGLILLLAGSHFDLLAT